MHLIYLQMKSRVILSPETPLKVKHVADVYGADEKKTKELLEVKVDCPHQAGIWKISAIHAISSVAPYVESVTPLGPDACYVHLIPKEKQNGQNRIRSVFAFVVLLVGSMLAISWFQADVNMAEAQNQLFSIITGRKLENPWLISIPYAIGVFFGVALFYTLLGKKDTVSPLEIKLSEYHETSEKAVGKTP